MVQAGLSELTAFIAIAEQQSFRAAARVLGTSPSALSHAMRSLEAKLSVRLFNRTTRSVALTEAGEQLLGRVRPAMTDLENALNEAASARNRPSGTIKISTSESGAIPLMRHVLPEFLERYPDIRIEFIVDSRFIDIVANGFDAGVRLHGDVPRDMIAVRFQPDMVLAVVASPEYLQRYGIPGEPYDLARHRCIRSRFENGALLQWELIHRGTSTHVDVDGPLTLVRANSVLAVEAALAGLGIAWLPLNYVHEHLEAGRLVHLLPEWSPTFAGLSLYYPANRHLPTAVALFVEAVRSRFVVSNGVNIRT
ncbi:MULTISPECIES: LysR family transcriptional regulator [Burkholderiaceae]|uniref:LysR family transcriptional regulator n=1 Tax=Burkholderiaceae TaxID=119060 RepID=UPI000E8ED99F|nr:MULTISPECIES: LysR family transcriptional regulator [Burkholderiaceae]HBD32809.1 LysR family transcriptional regulator [Cupriavidus sp.]KAB0600556.1 LysR family transcriptional regulator [Cupriavidus pauculus]MBR8163322.1 LysR family transcriptional regulator [Burkholderia vietnamiensis]MCA7942983.1 LysR family transcriptional regulator [Burkholderia vietnamiensis]MCA8148862.1 LysR family transcriptional regulator [Burkholderia vietnamiensis]